MNNISVENIRLIIVSMLSPLFSFFIPISNFMVALIIMFAFNIFCGMRADVVSIVKCKNFSIIKFKNALIELFLYLLIIQTIFAIIVYCGNKQVALLTIKSFTSVFLYVYLCNSFRNLIYAYPKNISFRIIYYIIRLEFNKAMPAHIQKIIERVKRENKNNAENSNIG